MIDIIYSILTDYIFPAIGASAFLSALLTKEYSNKWINLLVKIINYIGMNVFKAKNQA